MFKYKVITDNNRNVHENKAAELFCMADAFCKFFDALVEKHTLKPDKRRRYHHDSTISEAEVTLIMILFHDSGCRCLKHLYLEKVCRPLHHLFPKAASYNRFVEIRKEVDTSGPVHQEGAAWEMHRHKLRGQHSPESRQKPKDICP